MHGEVYDEMRGEVGRSESMQDLKDYDFETYQS